MNIHGGGGLVCGWVGDEEHLHTVVQLQASVTSRNARDFLSKIYKMYLGNVIITN